MQEFIHCAVEKMYKNPFNEPLSGLDIKDWIWHNSHTETRYSSLAKRMGAFFNLDNDKIYSLTLHDNIPQAVEFKNKEN